MSDEDTAAIATKIADAIFDDLGDRVGFDGWLDGVDSETQQQIRDEWVGIVRAHLEAKS